jgi:hypothetical protein
MIIATNHEGPKQRNPYVARVPGRGRYWDRTSDLCSVNAHQGFLTGRVLQGIPTVALSYQGFRAYLGLPTFTDCFEAPAHSARTVSGCKSHCLHDHA